MPPGTQRAAERAALVYFSAMERLDKILKQYWGYDTFLPLQREAMACSLNRRDSLVVLPTGGGKSLCFQAPALAVEGMAVVVSPLLSLMKDQVDALRANGVPAAKIDSTMNAQERRETHQAIQRRELKLLYVSPERVVQPEFAEYLKNAGVSFLVVDEAHCISHWGHDFRPEYRALKSLRAVFPDAAVHAFTATATETVRRDILQELELRAPEVLVGSFDRPNLRYRVQRRTDMFAQVRGLLDAHPGESGVVYCIRRADVESLCARLAAAGYRALPYHAGMEEADRRKNQEAFANETADVIVATVAFGMGIDKSNVRYVIHAAMPKSVEHYQQEAGRAGRDGLEADCTLLHSPADYQLWRSIVEKGEGEGRETALKKLQDISRYCEQTVCRHKALVEYFGEPHKKGNCGACDVCLGEIAGREDAQEIGRYITSAICDLQGMAGPNYTCLILTGSREARVLNKDHHRLPSHGLLKGHDPRTVRGWIEELVAQGFLRKEGEYNILRLTGPGTELHRGEVTPFLSEPAPEPVRKTAAKPATRKSVAPKVRPDVEPHDPVLFEELRRLRREKAEEMHVFPFIIFSDAALRDMARRKPTTREAFLEVSGVGQKKADAFGDEFVHAIKGYLDGQ